MIGTINIPWPGWELVEQIGRGQFGTVYKISSTKYGITEYAAMKVISIPNDPQMIEVDYSCGYDKDSVAAKYKSYLDDVLREYQLMMKVKGNAGIVRCDDISVEAHEDEIGWDVYIRMEYLTSVMKKLSDVSNEESVLKLGIDICGALEECERENILHRDIKPSNILVSSRGDFKLGDFGVSRTLESENTYGTKGIGTYDYMAPEIYNGEKYGKEADIYSLGMVMYWLLNDRTYPFLTKGKAPTAQEITKARQKRFNGEPLPRPTNGSESLKAVVLKACSFDPKNRYSTAKEMLDELTEIKYAKSHNGKPDSVNEKGIPVTNNEIVEAVNEKQQIDPNTKNTWNDSQETVGKSYSVGKSPINENATVGKDYVTRIKLNNNPSKTTANLSNAKSENNVTTTSKDNENIKRTNEINQHASENHADKQQNTNELKKKTIAVLSFFVVATIAIVFVQKIVELYTAKNYIVGSTVVFGTYELDNNTENGKEDIKWIVLANEGDKVLLISKYVLDYQPYNSELTNVTWETCSLRTWLNEDFINAAFDASEQDQILTVTNSNPDNPIWGTEGGKDTKDKIFLLSIDEANTYFSGDNSRATGSLWWLRSPGCSPNYAAFVYYFGEVYSNGDYVDDDYGVRPALWLNLNS